MKESFTNKIKQLLVKRQLPYLVLAISVALSFSTWQYYERSILEQKEQHYNEYVANVVNAIKDLLHRHEMILRGATGVFAVTGEVTRDEWRVFYEYQEISSLYPEFRDMKYFKVIPPAELARHIKEIKAEGFPDYRVWPEGERDIYVPVVYKEPLFEDDFLPGWLGYDMFADPERRVVLERARDTGNISLSGRLTRLPEDDQDAETSCLLAVPLYNQSMPHKSIEERIAAVEGYVAVSFSFYDLMAALFSKSINKIDFSLYDGSAVIPENLIYHSRISQIDHSAGRKSLFTSQQTLDLYGHRFTLDFATTPAFEATGDRAASKGILAFGLLLSFLLFFYLRALTVTGERAQSLADQMTATLRENEEQLRAITDNVSDIVVVCNAEGIVTYMSPQCHRLLGYQAAELIGQSVFGLVFPDDLPEVMQLFHDSLKTARPGKMEYRAVTKERSLVWVETRGDLLYDGEQISGTVLVTRDISDRKEMEEQIAASRKMYKSLVVTQQEMICRYRLDTTLTFVNDAYCRAFGKTRQELLGQKYLLFLPLEAHNEELETINKLTPTSPTLTREYSVLLPDGRTCWQEWTDFALFTEDGKIEEIQGTGRDITQRKQAEIEVRRQVSRTESMLQFAARLNNDLDLAAVGQTICQEIGRTFHLPLTACLLYNHTNRDFRLVASSWLPAGLTRAIESVSRVLYDEGVEHLGKVGIISDFAAVPNLPYPDLLAKHNIKHLLYAVIERDRSPLGIFVAGTGEEASFPDDIIELFTGLANQAASAIANARLYEEVQRRLRQIQALRNVDIAIIGSLDLSATLKVVLDEVTAQLGVDAAAIVLSDPPGVLMHYESWRGFKSVNPRVISVRMGEGFVGRVAMEQKAISIPNLREVEVDPVRDMIIEQEGFLAYYALPLIAKSQIQGVLEIYHRKPFNLSNDWFSFLEALAGQIAIAIDNAGLFQEVERSHNNLLLAYDATIEGWVHALDLKDKETEGHSRRVTEMTVSLARKMKMSTEELAHVKRGALLHDIGKMGIPDTILLKPGPLTDDEWEIMRKHPVYALDMLASIEYLRPALNIPYCHHEKCDGTGYPRGLKGKDIPLAARIFAVVDVYDALTSNRPYRPAWSKEKALQFIMEESGKYFDPEVVEVFLQEIG